MTSTWHEIRDHLARSSSTLDFHRNFQTICRFDAAIAAYGDPAALLDALHYGTATPSIKNKLLRSLVVAAQGKTAAADTALTVILLALWPALDSVRHRALARRMGSVDDITSEVLGRATCAIRDLDLERVSWIAGTIQRNTQRDMTRARQRETRLHHEIFREYRHLCETSASDAPAIASPALIQKDLIDLIGADAALVILVAIEGLTQAEAAAELGISMEAARKRYQRAIKRLRHAFEKNL